MFILENGDVFYDSVIILEFLDFIVGGNCLFLVGEVWFKVLCD